MRKLESGRPVGDFSNSPGKEIKAYTRMLAAGTEKVGGFKRYNNDRIHKLW